MASPCRMTFLVLVMAVALVLSSPARATDIPSRNQDISVAIQEMQTANYFTFVMLINMAPADLIQGNVSFLMPNDKTIARNMMPDTSAADFLLHHSIPSPLLFEHLQHFPTGSIVPTSKPDLVLRITNNGKRQFFLNNVRIVSPNICTRGSSIRCHGIDGVIQASQLAPGGSNVPSPDCHNCTSTRPGVAAGPLPPPPPPPPPSPPESGLNPIAAPPPSEDGSQQKSGSHRICCFGISEFLRMTCLMLLVAKSCIM